MVMIALARLKIHLGAVVGIYKNVSLVCLICFWSSCLPYTCCFANVNLKYINTVYLETATFDVVTTVEHYFFVAS